MKPRGPYVVFVALLAACSAHEDAPTAPAKVVATPAAERAKPLASGSVVDLFETKMLPTCSLNGGVCHNSNNYPDLRNVAALSDLIGLPCGMNAEADFPDACEPPGDHLVADGVDAEIERVTVAEGTATLLLDSDVPLGALGAAVIRRGADIAFDAGSSGAAMVATDPRRVIVSLAGATAEATAFFTPKLPLREDHVRPSDVNGNGVRGADLGWREIVPGRPDRSYLVARLWDTNVNPELMPRQCRAWDDEATRVLACWIEGLQTDASGSITNLYAPIELASCKFTVPSAGRCGTGLTISDIVKSDCAGCHGGPAPAQGLDLGGVNARDAVVGRRSREVPSMDLVVPGSPEASYLYAKLVGAPGITGDTMPKGGSLSAAKVDVVRAWIAAGAQ